MFVSKDLPSKEFLEKAAKRFPFIDVTATWTFLSVLGTGRELIEALEAHLARHGLSQGRFAMIMLLFRNQEHHLTPAELADRAGISRATVTGLVDKLERDGLVERRPHPKDRRKIFVLLTDSGMERVKEMLPDHSKRISGLMKNVPEEQRNCLIDSLELMRQGIPVLRDP